MVVFFFRIFFFTNGSDNPSLMPYLRPGDQAFILFDSMAFYDVYTVAIVYGELGNSGRDVSELRSLIYYIFQTLTDLPPAPTMIMHFSND